MAWGECDGGEGQVSLPPHPSQASILVLLRVLDRKGLQEAAPGATGATAEPAGGTRRRRAEGGLLMRPIICICNDQ